LEVTEIPLDLLRIEVFLDKYLAG